MSSEPTIGSSGMKMETYEIDVCKRTQCTEEQHAGPGLHNEDLEPLGASFMYHDCIEVLQDIDELNKVNEDGDTSLHLYIIIQNLPCIGYAINIAASTKLLNVQNKLLQSPLHLAVLTKQPSVVSKLVESGADVMSRDRNGNTALSIACRDGLFRIVNILVTAVKHRYVNECLQTQMSQLFAVVNYEGHTCIHLAANNNHLEVVKFIIESGADINTAEAKTGRTILHNACISGDKTLVRYLIKLRSCNINAKSYDSLTPFDLARARSHDTICMVLAAAGARYGYEADDMD